MWEFDGLAGGAQANLPTVWGGQQNWNLSEVEHAIDATWSRKHNHPVSKTAKAAEEFLNGFSELEKTKLSEMVAPFKASADDGIAIFTDRKTKLQTTISENAVGRPSSSI